MRSSQHGIARLVCVACSLLHGAMGADVHTVQELTDILVLGEAGLTDQSGGSRRQVNVGAYKLNLILRASTLLAQVVAKLNALTSLGDRRVDGKVRVGQARRVVELLLDTVEQVADVTAARLKGRQLLALGEVHPDPHFLASVPPM